jgi:hypothetical protein
VRPWRTWEGDRGRAAYPHFDIGHASGGPPLALPSPCLSWVGPQGCAAADASIFVCACVCVCPLAYRHFAPVRLGRWPRGGVAATAAVLCMTRRYLREDRRRTAPHCLIVGEACGRGAADAGEEGGRARRPKKPEGRLEGSETDIQGAVASQRWVRQA